MAFMKSLPPSFSPNPRDENAADGFLDTDDLNEVIINFDFNY